MSDEGECCAIINEGYWVLNVSCGVSGLWGGGLWGAGGGGLGLGGGGRKLRVGVGLEQGKEVRLDPPPIDQMCHVLQNQTFLGPDDHLSKSIYIRFLSYLKIKSIKKSFNFCKTAKLLPNF